VLRLGDLEVGFVLSRVGLLMRLMWRSGGVRLCLGGVRFMGVGLFIEGGVMNESEVCGLRSVR